jgi:hypothetical protein
MTDKEELTRGDALARVAVLEAELAELRKRVCVPDASTMARVLSDRAASACCVDPDDNWKIYGQEFIEDVRAMLAAPAPVERLATDGGRNQRFEGLFEGETPDQRDARLAAAAPVERVEQEAFSYYERAHGEKSPTHGMSLCERIAHVGGRTNAAGYMEFGSVMAVSALIDHVLRDSPAPKPAPAAAQDVAGLPFVRKILEKLERFRECAEDDEGVDIGRHWLDVLTRLGLLNRVQRSPARWEMTAQADDALEAANQQREGE